MPKLIITGDGSSKATEVTDPAHAVRLVSEHMRKIGTDASVLAGLQKWASASFKIPLRLTINGKAVVIDYRS